jgi:hypothetical protein
MLALETVNSNVVDVTPRCRSRSLPKFTKGAPAQVFEQRIEGDWEQLGR